MKASSPRDPSWLPSSPPSAEYGGVRSWLLDVQDERVAPAAASPKSWLLELGDRDPERPVPKVLPPVQVAVAWREEGTDSRWPSLAVRVAALVLLGCLVIGTIDALLGGDEPVQPERVLVPSSVTPPPAEVELVLPDESTVRSGSRRGR